MRQHIGGVALAPRGLGGCVARILLKCFFAGHGRGGLTPSRLTPYSPYPLARTGGEKYLDFSDSGAAAICFAHRGERNIRIPATRSLRLYADAYRGHFSFLQDCALAVC